MEDFLSSSKESTIGRRTERLVQSVRRKWFKGSSILAEDSSWAPGPVNCKATLPGPRTHSSREVHSPGHSPSAAATCWFLQVTTASAVPSSTRSLKRQGKQKLPQQTQMVSHRDPTCLSHPTISNCSSFYLLPLIQGHLSTNSHRPGVH